MSGGPGSPAIVASTLFALVAFAGNSLLCRGALGAGAIDPASFSLVRLACGALTLALLVRTRRSRTGPAPARPWAGALALALYAVAFSFAYVRLDAGTGALVLFAVTQATMIGWGIRRGERPGPLEWLGIAVALAGLAGLAAPGRAAPDPASVGLMAAAGVGWGVYSLLGRGAADPLGANAAAFARATLPAALLALPVLADRAWTARGLLLAALSGAVASGLGYSVWYVALPHLSRTRAAAVQLAVPVLAAAAGVALLGEKATLRLVAAGSLILGGVALAVVRPGAAGRAPAARP